MKPADLDLHCFQKRIPDFEKKTIRIVCFNISVNTVRRNIAVFGGKVVLSKS